MRHVTLLSVAFGHVVLIEGYVEENQSNIIENSSNPFELVIKVYVIELTFMLEKLTL
jgi:hypothetical protein